MQASHAAAALVLALLLAWPAPATASEAGDMPAAWPVPTAGDPALDGPDDDDPVLSLLRARGMLDEPDVHRARASGANPDPAAELVLAAMSFLDTPYLWGGASAETGFDCSGFTRHV
ncbi:MAG TPA: NlpC/P60 family protein, partial [Rubrivivax sp.]|nr:NlpC/P60 family protein [Rubrivivax sp.]